MSMLHVTCLRRELARVLTLLTHATTVRSTLPILADVLIESVGEDRLRLAATDLELGIECVLDATIEQQGRIAVPVRVLLTCLGTQRDEERVTLSAHEAPAQKDGALLPVLLVDASVTICGADAAAFPLLTSLDPGVHLWQGPARLFKEMVGQVAFAASKDAAFSLRSNVWLHFEGRMLTCAASDASRCALRTVPSDTELPAGLLLAPAQAMRKLVALLSSRGEVRIEVDPRKSLLCVRSERGRFLTRLSDPHARPFWGTDHVANATRNGTGRPFDSLIPTHPRTVVHVPRKSLRAIMRKRHLPISCMLQKQEDQAYLVLTVYSPEDVRTHRLPVQADGPLFAPCWLSMYSLGEILAQPGTSAHLVLGFDAPHTNAILLRWGERDDRAGSSYAYAFAPLHPVAAVQHAAVRRTLSAELQQFLAEWLSQWPQPAPGETHDGPLLEAVRVEASFLIVSMLEQEILPTEAQIKQSAERVRQIALRLNYDRVLAWGQEMNAFARDVAISAFAHEGSTLETSYRLVRVNAAEIRVALAERRMVADSVPVETRAVKSREE